MTSTSPLTAPAVLLFRGRGVISTLIRWQTRGQYSHAALLLPNGKIVEAWQGAGVRIAQPTDWDGIDFFSVSGLSAMRWKAAIDFALGQVGRGYDYRGVLRFVTRRRTPADRRWFCSELVFAAIEAAGMRLLRGIDAAAVSPQLLSLSPYLLPLPPLRGGPYR